MALQNPIDLDTSSNANTDNHTSDAEDTFITELSPILDQSEIDHQLKSPKQHRYPTPICDKDFPDCLSPGSSAPLSHIYLAKELRSDSFVKMNTFREKLLLCDVTLRVGTKDIRAHRLVLAATFDYFSSMFTQDMLEKEQKIITLLDIDEEAVDKLITFAYTSILEITTQNVQNLLTAASILQVQCVLDACAEFLGSHLATSNCLSIRNFAESHGCPSLVEDANKFFRTHFRDCASTDEFYQLPLEILSELIKSDDLNVKNEEEVFESLESWFDYQVKIDPTIISRYAESLKYVRLALLPLTYLATRVEKNKYIRSDLSCRDLIDEAKNYHLLSNDNNVCGSYLTSSIPRKSTAGKLYAIGGRGKAGDPFQSVECYNYHSNSWHQVTSLNSRRRHVGVAFMNNLIWAVGGHDGEAHLNTVEYYNSDEDQWHNAAPMISYRRGIAVAALPSSDGVGPLYAIGGLDGTTCFTYVERYDPNENEWVTVAPLNTARGGVGVTTLNSFIYAAGGNDGTSSLMTVERYDPHYNRWTMQPFMSKRRAGIGLAELNGCLYAVGGFDDASPLDSVERHDPRTNSWVYVKPMSTPRGGVGVASLGGCLFAVGGHNGKHYLNSVECYTPHNDTWTEISPMKISRAGAGVVTFNPSTFKY